MNAEVKCFRLWVNEIWRQNCDEHLSYRDQAHSLDQYFKKYKYWLKREYRLRTKNEPK